MIDPAALIGALTKIGSLVQLAAAAIQHARRGDWQRVNALIPDDLHTTIELRIQEDAADRRFGPR